MPPEQKIFDAAAVDYIAAMVVDRAFFLARRGHLVPPIGVVIYDQEQVILEFTLPDLSGNVQPGRLRQINGPLFPPILVQYRAPNLGEHVLEGEISFPSAPDVIQ